MPRRLAANALLTVSSRAICIAAGDGGGPVVEPARIIWRGAGINLLDWTSKVTAHVPFYRGFPRDLESFGAYGRLFRCWAVQARQRSKQMMAQVPLRPTCALRRGLPRRRGADLS